MQTIKLEKYDVLNRTALKVDPGKGAVDFAKRYVEEMTLLHVEAVCKDLIAGNFEEIDDKKVRRCQYCGYFYRDNTKNNSSLVCSDECKSSKDIVLKAFRRKEKAEGKPRRASFKEMYYTEHLEYPFFTSEKKMMEYSARHEVSYGDEFEETIGKVMTNRMMGGKKKSTQNIEYNGDEVTSKIKVRIASHGNKEAGQVVKYKADCQTELMQRYGARKLEQERIRAVLYTTGHM